LRELLVNRACYSRYWVGGHCQVLGIPVLSALMLIDAVHKLSIGVDLTAPAFTLGIIATGILFRTYCPRCEPLKPDLRSSMGTLL